MSYTVLKFKGSNRWSVGYKLVFCCAYYDVFFPKLIDRAQVLGKGSISLSFEPICVEIALVMELCWPGPNLPRWAPPLVRPAQSLRRSTASRIKVWFCLGFIFVKLFLASAEYQTHVLG